MSAVFRIQEYIRRELAALLRGMTKDQVRDLISVPPRYRRFLAGWRRDEPEVDGMVRRSVAYRDMMLAMLEATPA